MRPSGISVPPFPADYRASGLLMHVTSLPSPYGVGDLGPAAISWIDRLAQAGQSWWQMLPLGPTGYGNSPYQSLSSFAGNGLLISPDWLIEDELLRPGDCPVSVFPQNKIDYSAVTPFKHGLLVKAWGNFSAGARADLLPAFEQFRKDQEGWLEDYALFRALKIRFGGTNYLEWPAEFSSARAGGARSGSTRTGESDRTNLFRAVPFVPSGRKAQGTSSQERHKVDRRHAFFCFT